MEEKIQQNENTSQTGEETEKEAGMAGGKRQYPETSEEI